MPNDPRPLAGRVALVTGGARRVGKATAIELASRGADVVVHANSSMDEADSLAERLRDDHDVRAEAMRADLADESAARGLVDRVLERFDSIDALVHCAAIWPKQPLEELTADSVRECLEVNTLATLVLAQHAGLAMADQERGGVVVLLGDTATAHDGRPYPGYAAYHASKAAIPGMTRALAVELAGRNPRVRVNAVLPGPVICEHLPGEPEEPSDRKDHARRAALIETTDRGGYGKAEHLAHAIAFLVENPFVTAVALPVDGGGRLK